MSAVLQIFVGTMFLLNGLSPVPLASFNFFIAAAITPFTFFTKINPVYDFRRDDFVLLIIFIYGVVAWAFYSAPVDQGRIQATLQWAASFLVLWIGVRRWIIVSEISFQDISRAAFYGSVALSIAVLFEFYTANTSGKYLSDYVPFSIDIFPSADLFFTGGVRPRGFSAEAGFTSMVFEALVPISLFHFRKISALTRISYCAVTALALVLLYSTSTFISLAIAIAIFYVVRINLKGGVQLFVIFTAAFYLIAANADFFYQASGYKIFEFFYAFGGSSTYTAGSRQEAWLAGIKVLTEHPFGSGWGTILQEAKASGSEIDQMVEGTGLISLWLELAVAVGIVPFIVLMMRIGRIIIDLAKTRATEATLCFFSLTMVFVHHWSVYEQWFPMLWFCLALSQVILKATSQEGVRDMAPLKIPFLNPPYAIAR